MDHDIIMTSHMCMYMNMYLVNIGSYKIIQFVKNAIDDFDQQMALLVLWGFEEWEIAMKRGSLNL